LVLFAPRDCDKVVLVFGEVQEDWSEPFFLVRFWLPFLAALSEVDLQVLPFPAELDPLAVRELFPVGTMEATCTFDALVLLYSDFPLRVWAVW
jgi:hypothetical protein